MCWEHTYYRERTGEHTVERTLRNVLRGPHWGTGGCIITNNVLMNVLCIIGNALGNILRFVLGMYWGTHWEHIVQNVRRRCQKVAIIF